MIPPDKLEASSTRRAMMELMDELRPPRVSADVVVVSGKGFRESVAVPGRLYHTVAREGKALYGRLRRSATVADGHDVVPRASEGTLRKQMVEWPAGTGASWASGIENPRAGWRGGVVLGLCCR